MTDMQIVTKPFTTASFYYILTLQPNSAIFANDMMPVNAVFPHKYNPMLSRVVRRQLACFSQWFYQPSVLEYPINRHDSDLLRNKQQMDEANSNFSSILRKATVQNDKKVLDKMHKSGKMLVR